MGGGEHALPRASAKTGAAATRTTVGRCRQALGQLGPGVGSGAVTGVNVLVQISAVDRPWPGPAAQARERPGLLCNSDSEPDIIIGSRVTGSLTLRHSIRPCHTGGAARSSQYYGSRFQCNIKKRAQSQRA